ncbi:hypothetical protein OEZ86_000023 [Tetradesmus obliquus]|nr:hypothetical protein OEZ86_000023 [Tetradesmus obliquus]
MAAQQPQLQQPQPPQQQEAGFCEAQQEQPRQEGQQSHQDEEEEEEYPELPRLWRMWPTPRQLLEFGAGLESGPWLAAYRGRLEPQLLAIHIYQFRCSKALERRRSGSSGRPIAELEAHLCTMKEHEQATRECMAMIDNELRSRQGQQQQQQQQQASLGRSKPLEQFLLEQEAAPAPHLQQLQEPQSSEAVAQYCSSMSPEEYAQRNLSDLPCDLLQRYHDMLAAELKGLEEGLQRWQQRLDEARREGRSSDAADAEEDLADCQMDLQSTRLCVAAAKLEQSRRRQLQGGQQQAGSAAPDATAAPTPAGAAAEGVSNTAAAAAAAAGTLGGKGCGGSPMVACGAGSDGQSYQQQQQQQQEHTPILVDQQPQLQQPQLLQQQEACSCEMQQQRPHQEQEQSDQEEEEEEEGAWQLRPSPQQLLDFGARLETVNWLTAYRWGLDIGLWLIHVRIFRHTQLLDRQHSSSSSSSSSSNSSGPSIAQLEAYLRLVKEQEQATLKCMAMIDNELCSRKGQQQQQQQQGESWYRSSQLEQYLLDDEAATAPLMRQLSRLECAEATWRPCMERSTAEFAQRHLSDLPCDLLQRYHDMLPSRVEWNGQMLQQGQQRLDEARREGRSSDAAYAEEEVAECEMQLQFGRYLLAGVELEQSRRRQLQSQQQQAAAAAGSTASDATAALEASGKPPAGDAAAAAAAAAAAGTPPASGKRGGSPMTEGLPDVLALFGPFTVTQLRQAMQATPGLRRKRGAERKAHLAQQLADAGVMPPFEGLLKQPPTPEQLQRFQELWQEQQQQQSKRQRTQEPSSSGAEDAGADSDAEAGADAGAEAPAQAGAGLQQEAQQLAAAAAAEQAEVEAQHSEQQLAAAAAAAAAAEGGVGAQHSEQQQQQQQLQQQEGADELQVQEAAATGIPLAAEEATAAGSGGAAASGGEQPQELASGSLGGDSSPSDSGSDRDGDSDSDSDSGSPSSGARACGARAAAQLGAAAGGSHQAAAAGEARLSSGHDTRQPRCSLCPWVFVMHITLIVVG